MVTVKPAADSVLVTTYHLPFVFSYVNELHLTVLCHCCLGNRKGMQPVKGTAVRIPKSLPLHTDPHNRSRHCRQAPPICLRLMTLYKFALYCIVLYLLWRLAQLGVTPENGWFKQKPRV